jgi:5-methyltetrahydrofolate--homocysteine methyltransferase
MLDTLYNAILEGDLEAAVSGVNQAIEAGNDPGVILSEGMIRAMAEVGQRYEDMEYFIPDMLVSARAMKGSLAILKPYLVEQDVKPVGKVVIGTVKGDLHDIGKNLVSIMLSGAGFEVVDLGTDVSPAKFVAAVREHEPHFLGISALLTTTMLGIETVILAFEEAELRNSLKIMIGGAPVTQEFAEKIGADIFAPDAASAAKEATAQIRAS